MYSKLKLLIFVVTTILLFNCSQYSFGGIDTGDAKTVQILFFPNNGNLVEPSLSPLIQSKMQDFINQRTKLEQVNSNADLTYSGEISDYRINPISATAQQTAAQNRLTISVNVQFFNRLNEDDNFEKKFSFYSDFNANTQPVGNVLNNLLEQITDRIIQDIFNSSIAKTRF